MKKWFKERFEHLWHPVPLGLGSFGAVSASTLLAYLMDIFIDREVAWHIVPTLFLVMLTLVGVIIAVALFCATCLALLDLLRDEGGHED